MVENNIYDRWIVYSSDDEADMQHPVSTAMCEGVFDAYEDAYEQASQHCDGAHSCIVKVKLTTLVTEYIIMPDDLDDDDDADAGDYEATEGLKKDDLL